MKPIVGVKDSQECEMSKEAKLVSNWDNVTKYSDKVFKSWKTENVEESLKFPQNTKSSNKYIVLNIYP